MLNMDECVDISSTHSLSWVTLLEEEWSARQGKDMHWNLIIMLSSGAFIADRKQVADFCLECVLAPALSCSSGETSLRKHLCKFKWTLAERWASLFQSVLVGLTFLACDYHEWLSFLFRGFSIWVFPVCWSFHLCLVYLLHIHNDVKINCNTIGTFSNHMTNSSSQSGFAVQYTWY